MASDQVFKFQGVGLTKQEKFAGNKKFADYRSHYHVEAYSDMQMLEELIYREILQERLKHKIEQLEEKYKKEEKEYSVPRHVVETMNENFEQVLSIKEKLGMFTNKEGDDSFKYIQQLKEKFKIWCSENTGSRTLVCPHCSKIVLLRIRTDIWEAQQHPMFKDKTLYNQHLIDMYLTGKINAEDVAKVLGTSPKYCEWLIEKFHQRKTKENE